MFHGFFGRMARKWWLMLMLGIIIGLAAGLPVGGEFLPDYLVGSASNEDVYLPPENINAKLNEIIQIRGIIFSYDKTHLEKLGSDVQYLNRFKAIATTGSTPICFKTEATWGTGVGGPRQDPTHTIRVHWTYYITISE